MASLRICYAGCDVFYLFQPEQSRLQFFIWDGNSFGNWLGTIQQPEMDSIPDFQRKMEILVVSFFYYRQLYIPVFKNFRIQ